MNIGFFIYRQYPFISANTAIGYDIALCLNKMEGYHVHLIGFSQSDIQRKVTDFQGMPIHFINRTYKEVRKGRLQNYLQRFIDRDYFYKRESRRLMDIVEENKIDLLICVVAPAETSIIAYGAKLNIPIILYQLDPFYNHNDIIDNKLREYFLKIAQKTSWIFTTDLLFDCYKKDEKFNNYLDKISILHFPKIKRHIECTNNSRCLQKKPQLLYGGSLYRDIRSPNILLNVKKVLGNDVDLLFLGTCDSDSDFRRLQESGIICMGHCSPEHLFHAIAESDVLINIGNKVHNQLGSKLIEYISTGKPILNITQIDQCPSLYVLRNYSNCLSLSAEDLGEKTTILKMKNFIFSPKNAIDWNTICELYHEYTPEYVTKKIEQKINDIINK